MDRESFEALYQSLESSLYNVIYRWVWDEGEAMDIVQEAFVRLWTARARVEPAGAKAYVFRVGLNLATDRHRASKWRRWVGLEESQVQASWALQGAQPETELLNDEGQRLVREGVEKLPLKIRKVVVLARFAEMSYEEIGQLLGIPSGTVGSRYHKGVALLRTFLDSRHGQWRKVSRIDKRERGVT